MATSPEQRIKQLLEHEEIGDRKPSQFLRHLKSLAGASVPDHLIRTLWLGRLPANMQAILASRANDDLQSVADQADRIAEISHGIVATVAAKEIQKETYKTSLEDKVDRLAQQVATLTAQLSKERSSHRRPRSRSRRREESTDNGWCFYHARFKEKARKCAQPCNFRKRRQAENQGGSP